MSTAPKAIETRYAGCRFRSRLEARWAVFFDKMQIKWQYEPQGFQCEKRLSLDSGTINYLPDFYLPDLGKWGEVKGSWTTAERDNFLECAAYLSSGGGGGCRGSEGDVLLMGDIPEWRSVRAPILLHMHKGDLLGLPLESLWATTGECPVPVGPYHLTVAKDSGEFNNDVNLLLGLPTDRRDWFDAGFDAARGARFEHGERGA